MSALFLDIETIPGQRPGIREEIAAAINPPGNMSKPETIAAWERDTKPGVVDAAYARAGLNGASGEVWCVAWALDDGEIQCASRLNPAYGETEVLATFYDWLRGQMLPETPTFVGHYITGFDLRFLWQRSVVRGVQPKSRIPFDAKPWGDGVYDTMVQWAGAKGAISQDNLCRALGLPAKDGMDGSQVWQAVQDGRYAEVVDYCKGDVARVREIYKRMTFAEAY